MGEPVTENVETVDPEKQMRIDVISALYLKWSPRLYLDEWRFTFNTKSEPNPEDRPGFNCAAEITVSADYKEATVDFFPLFWKKDPDEREMMFVHELCHCHTQDAKDAVAAGQCGELVTPRQNTAINERLTQTMAMIAMKAFDP